MTAGGSAAAQPGAPAAAPAFPDPQAFAHANRVVRADKSIQFDFPEYQFKPPHIPEWLSAVFRFIGRLFSAFGSGWIWLFWIIVALAVIALAITLFPPARNWVVGVARRGRKRPDVPARWVPEEAVARQLLDEADALAARGQYDEAVHLILYRSIEDIEHWRGDLVRPSLTSRDIARAEALPERARGVFAALVALVERSLFAGRGLSADDWHRARADYSGFALGGR